MVKVNIYPILNQTSYPLSLHIPTVLCKSNANELRRNSANFADFAEKNANFRFKRNIGENSRNFRTSIVQVLAKLREGRLISVTKVRCPKQNFARIFVSSKRYFVWTKRKFVCSKRQFGWTKRKFVYSRRYFVSTIKRKFAVP